MSARAAWRLEAFGFEQVYRYQPGKDDWLVARLPMEGRGAETVRAADVARGDVPTCAPQDRIADVAQRVREGGWPLAVVLNDERIVLGRLRAGDLEERPEATAAEIMLDGPRSIRGTRAASEMARWLDERRVRLRYF